MEQEMNGSVGSQLAAFGSGVMAGANRYVQRASLQAKIKKLKFLDLRQAHYALGRQAYAQKIAPEMWEASYRKIAEIENAIAAKSGGLNAGENATQLQKLKALGISLKMATEAEGMNWTLRRRIVALGREIEKTPPPVELENETAALAAVRTRIQKLEDQQAILASSPQGAQRKKMGLAAKALLGLGLGCGGIVAVVGIFFIVAIISGFFASGGSPHLARTIGYWRSLQQIRIDSTGIGGPNYGHLAQKQFDAFSDEAKALADKWERCANHIRSLSAFDVDPELVQDAVQHADLYAAVGDFFRKQAQYVQLRKAYEASYSSGTAQLNAFVRGALGESALNIYNEAKSTDDQFAQAGTLLDKRLAQINQRGGALDAMHEALRVTLEQRYGTAFR